MVAGLGVPIFRVFTVNVSIFIESQWHTATGIKLVNYFFILHQNISHGLSVASQCDFVRND